MRYINIAILFSGNGSNLENIVRFLGQASTKQWLDSKHISLHIAIALCNNPNAYGVQRCKNLQIPCVIINHKDYATREAFDEAMIQELESKKIDLVILAGFMRVLSERFINRFRAINIHPSFLPFYKGAKAIQESFYGAQDFGGVSVHWVSLEVDCGEIILQEKLPKIPNESLQEFEARIHALEYELYPKAILQALENLGA